MSEMRQLMEAVILKESATGRAYWLVSDSGSLDLEEEIELPFRTVHRAKLIITASANTSTEAWIYMWCDSGDDADKLATGLSPHVSRPDFLTRMLGARATYFRAGAVEHGFGPDGDEMFISLKCLDYPNYVVEYAN